MGRIKYFIQLSVPKYGENSLIPVIRDGHVMFELNIESDTERSRRILSLEQVMELRDSLEKVVEDYVSSKAELGKYSFEQ